MTTRQSGRAHHFDGFRHERLGIMLASSAFTTDHYWAVVVIAWAVTDPRDNKRVALKKMSNVFQNVVSAIRVYRELRMLCHFRHENVLSAQDILQPGPMDFLHEMYP
ncbi:mitogen-activated protein kinase [Elysia marginata]|uniref:Mitogen-activated protein kinase n=1 Tax=Elysia marginata TaxID=1093978 RepID=A0AAV4HKT7_9GAST|nr:mitogen-activated protein kinase [Elysia marginata]